MSVGSCRRRPIITTDIPGFEMLLNMASMGISYNKRYSGVDRSTQDNTKQNKTTERNGTCGVGEF